MCKCWLSSYKTQLPFKTKPVLLYNKLSSCFYFFYFVFVFILRILLLGRALSRKWWQGCAWVIGQSYVTSRRLDGHPIRGEVRHYLSSIEPQLHHMTSDILIRKEGNTQLTKDIEKKISAYIEKYKIIEVNERLDVATFLDPDSRWSSWRRVKRTVSKKE